MKPTKFNTFKKSLLKNSLFSELLYSIAILTFMFFIITNPNYFSKSTINGLNLFIGSVLPGLFPFMFLTKLLTEIGFIFKITKKCDNLSYKLFGTPGISFYAFFMSILSGYPIGAKIIADLYEKNLINQDDAKKMSVFCTTSGPIFIIGAVGAGMFIDLKIGLIIYISHILSSIVLGMIYKQFTKNKFDSSFKTPKCFIYANNNQNLISTCLSQTINSLFLVGAYITIFYLFTDLLEIINIFPFISKIIYLILKPFGINSSQCTSIVYGFLEVTRGCKSISINFNKTSIALCSGIISFSGISIIMQSMAFLKTTKIKMHSFILNKLMHFILSILLCLILLIVFM